MPISPELFEHIECQTASEFINNLRASHKNWLPDDATHTPWIFRGQGNADWSLKATVWREEMLGKIKNELNSQIDDIIEQAISYLCRQYPKNHDSQTYKDGMKKHSSLRDIFMVAAYEIKQVRNFTEFINELGFPVPRSPLIKLDTGVEFNVIKIFAEAMTFMRNEEFDSFKFPVWASKRQPVAALARHHGIPLSLLDFTGNPLVAAFFAASYIPNDASYLAVWAVHSDVIGGSNLLRQLDIFRSELGYLHAQDGLLLFDILSDDYYLKHKEWPCISNAISETDTEYEPSHYLRKVTAPASEAREILRLLRAEKISEPHLKPSFDVIANEIRKEFVFKM